MSEQVENPPCSGCGGATVKFVGCLECLDCGKRIEVAEKSDALPRTEEDFRAWERRMIEEIKRGWERALWRSYFTAALTGAVNMYTPEAAVRNAREMADLAVEEERKKFGEGK